MRDKLRVLWGLLEWVKILLFRTILPWYFYIKWQDAIRLLYKKGVKIKDYSRTEFHH